MIPSRVPSPIDAVAEFLERIKPYDPEPDSSPVATMELRIGHDRAEFAMTEHSAYALQEALHRYYDPHDRGQCDKCGGRRLDDSLACQDCGYVNGVFGEVLRLHAANVAARDQAAN
jgi:hypothetical protein